MKKALLLISFLFGFIVSFSQFSHVELLIGLTEAEATKKLDSLNKLKSNPYYQVERDMSPDGYLILKSFYSLDDEGYYKCSSIFLWFTRIKGVEYCIQQIILGDIKYAQDNMAFIKDNFTKNNDGKWEKQYSQSSINNVVKVLASFERIEGNHPTFKITYEINNE